MWRDWERWKANNTTRKRSQKAKPSKRACEQAGERTGAQVKWKVETIYPHIYYIICVYMCVVWDSFERLYVISWFIIVAHFITISVIFHVCFGAFFDSTLVCSLIQFSNFLSKKLSLIFWLLAVTCAVGVLVSLPWIFSLQTHRTHSGNRTECAKEKNHKFHMRFHSGGFFSRFQNFNSFSFLLYPFTSDERNVRD